MTTSTHTRPWDFTHVLDLVNSLSTTDHAGYDRELEREYLASPFDEGGKILEDIHDIVSKDLGTTPPKLGDFSKIWQYLGAPLDSPATETPPLTTESAPVLTRKADYASDGAVFFKASSRTRKEGPPQDQYSAEEPTTDAPTDRSASPQSPTLTKSQRKKKNRRERKAQQAVESIKAATVSESEADSLSQRTPARKASAHSVATHGVKRYNLRARDTDGKAFTTAVTTQPQQDSTAPQYSVAIARAKVAEKLQELKLGLPKLQPPQYSSAPRPDRPSQSTMQQGPPAMITPKQHNISTNVASHSQLEPQERLPVTPSRPRVMQLVPSTVQPPRISAALSLASPSNQNIAPKTTTKSKHVIEPIILRSGEDRHWALFMKLVNDFWIDRKHLIAPMNLTTHNNDPKGIHVFVDASNIFIGFTEQLKRSRGISQWAQVPQVDPSFDALALLMERRRPVAKRVLVGSMPHLPAFDKAKAVGYECSILEKVYKARELTDRQIYYNERDRQRHSRGAKTPLVTNSAHANGSALVNGSGAGGMGSGSGSETNAAASPPQFARARMIEQGVDEILHLKILESVVDTEVPATIVLATGDAAQAEYSQGFMAMAERALKKGWTVELVSWSKNISMMYSRKAWVETWGKRFRVVLLDDYAEELLDM